VKFRALSPLVGAALTTVSLSAVPRYFSEGSRCRDARHRQHRFHPPRTTAARSPRSIGAKSVPSKEGGLSRSPDRASDRTNTTSAPPVAVCSRRTDGGIHVGACNGQILRRHDRGDRISESNPDIVYVGAGEYPIRATCRTANGVWRTSGRRKNLDLAWPGRHAADLTCRA